MGRRINHPHRNKTLYILRGLPGTGKTEKARDIQRRYGGVIISADDYHRNGNGELHIRPENLNDGHIRAREQALQAMDQGLDPVIIDNSNMSWQEMFPYVVMGFYRGYWITFILRIDTFHVSLDEIVRRCPTIPRGKLKRMKKRYQTVKHVYQILWDDDCNWKYRELLDDYEEEYEEGEIVRVFDYFIDDDGETNFDPYYLDEAHDWAQQKAFEAMLRGAHPVIACNNNITLWEMYPYVLMGSSAGYYIEFVDMEKDSLDSLYRKTKQRVPFHLLKKWERRYVEVCRGRAGICQILNDPDVKSDWETDMKLGIRAAFLLSAKNNF